jgi:type I restriction enzyme S subunit
MKNNWQIRKLKEVAKVVTGTTPKKSVKSYYGGELPLVKPSQLQNSYITEASEYLTEKGWEQSRWLPENSTLVTCIGDLGRVGLTKYPVAFNQQINGVKFGKEIDYKFGYYYLQSPKAREYYRKKASATTVTILNKTKFSKLEIPFPDISQQEAIALKLESLFSKMHAGEVGLKQVQQQLKVYRQAVLKKAFDSSRFDRIKLEKIVSLRKERFDPKKSNENRYYIGLGNISKGTGVITGSGYSNETRSTKNVFYTNDVLYGKLRPYLNKVALVEKQGVCSTDILVLIPNTNILPELLKFCLLQRDFVSFATSSSTGVQHPRTKWGIIKEYKFNFPLSIKEQELTLQEIKSQLSIIEAVKNNIKQIIEKNNHLSQSILKKAFNGGLI